MRETVKMSFMEIKRLHLCRVSFARFDGLGKLGNGVSRVFPRPLTSCFVRAQWVQVPVFEAVGTKYIFLLPSPVISNKLERQELKVKTVNVLKFYLFTIQHHFLIQEIQTQLCTTNFERMVFISLMHYLMNRSNKQYQKSLCMSQKFFVRQNFQEGVKGLMVYHKFLY